MHLWKTYNLPVLLSGLSALPLRPPNIKSLSLFQNKVHRGFLKLSQSSPIPCLYFLLGELPIEARLHMNTFTIFHIIWSNPDTTIHRLVKYLLKMCDSSSTTWTSHINILAQKYELPCLLRLMEDQTAWSKASWKSMVETKVTIYHEKMLRISALKNSKMQYLNVRLSGLTCQPHPALRNILTTQDVKKLRLHLKFLT